MQEAARLDCRAPLKIHMLDPGVGVLFVGAAILGALETKLGGNAIPSADAVSLPRGRAHNRMRMQFALAAALVAALVQPTQVFAHPSVEFKAPVDGTTVSGVVKGSECEVLASRDTTTVDFYLHGRKISYNLHAPWNCSFDSTALGEGWHTLWAVAGDNHGTYSSTKVRIKTSSGQSDSGSGGKATLGPLGSAPLGDAEAASRVRRSSWEPRPGNTSANQTSPTSAQLQSFYAAGSWGPCGDPLRRRVTGDFTGTTDEILQWAAHKWRLDEDVLRAVAVRESNWNQLFHGDRGNGESYGLMQAKSSVQRGTYPLSQRSTAFNVDFYGAGQRYYLEGCADWIDRQAGSRGTYAAGDMWGSVGAWYSGAWHDWGAESYISKVKHELWTRRGWEQAGF